MKGRSDVFAALAGADPACNTKGAAESSRDIIRINVLAAVDRQAGGDHMLQRGRRAVRYSVVFAIVCCCFVVAVGSAFSWPGDIIDFFSGVKPPTDVSRTFAELPIGAPFGMDPHVDERNVRRITAFPSTAGDVILWAGPAQNGYCYLFSGLTSGCRQTAGTEPRIDVSLLLPTQQFEAFLIVGNIDSNAVDHVDVVYADGSRHEAKVVRVSTPIGATFFMYEVPRDQWTSGVLPSYVLGSRGDGASPIRSSGRLNALSDRDRRILHAPAGS
jgi:hypothetical protein